MGVVLTTIDGREFFQFKFQAVTNGVSVGDGNVKVWKYRLRC